jgi:hypothetical protein
MSRDGFRGMEKLSSAHTHTVLLAHTPNNDSTEKKSRLDSFKLIAISNLPQLSSRLHEVLSFCVCDGDPDQRPSKASLNLTVAESWTTQQHP